MYNFLIFLIIAGAILWGVLYYEKTQIVPFPFSIFTAEHQERCAEFDKTVGYEARGYDLEGMRDLGYGDRIKQIMYGCW